MADQEYGKCDICGKTAVLTRTFYDYGIKCLCHSPTHFEVVSHCADCEPHPPKRTTIEMHPVTR
jgi:hypothetical protein